MTGEHSTRILAIGALIAACGFLLFNPLRLAFIANTLIPYLYFNLLIMVCCGALFLWNVRTLEVRPVEFLICLLVLATAVMTNYEGRQIVDILTDFLRPLFFIAVVVAFRNFTNINHLDASRGLRGSLKATMWITLFIVPASWGITLYIQPLYPAYASIDSIFGLGWLLATGHVAFQALYLGVLFASGKRGVYLAAIVVILLCYRNKKLSIPSWLGLFLTLFICMILLASYISEVQHFFLKGGAYDGSDGNSDLINVLSGGRIDELQGAVAAMNSPLQLFFGAGLGFAYEVDGFEDAAGLHRNLHFTPASLAIYYGIPFTLVFFYYLASFFLAALRVTRNCNNAVVFAYAVYCMASMVFLFTEFSVFAYVNFAISCGVIAAAVRDERLSKQAEKI